MNDDLIPRSLVVPTVDQRTVAETLWGLYVALIQVGFTDAQAITIVVSTVASAT